MLKRKIALLCLLLGALFSAIGQNSTSSPFSRYGYGRLVDAGSSKGLCGLSAGLRPRQHVNSGNPASYTAIDSLNFRFELGAAVTTSFYTEGDARHTDVSCNLELIAMQFPITKWMGFALGLTPYSVVGYDYEVTKTDVQDASGRTLSYTNNYKGTGGINELFFGLGFRPWSCFSIGVNGKFLFGTVETASSVNFDEEVNANFYHNTTQTASTKIKDFRFDVGAQYEFAVREEKSLILGVTFEPKSALNTEAEKELRTAGVDTVRTVYDSDFDLPMSLAFGLSYEMKNKLLLGVDYKLQQWADAAYFGEKSFENRHKVAFGAELLPDVMSKKYFRRVSYRLGFSTANSYFKVGGDVVRENVLCVGFGFPLKRGLNPTMINFNIDYGFNSGLKEGMMNEQYLRFTLTATMNERWFVRRRLD